MNITHDARSYCDNQRRLTRLTVVPWFVNNNN